MPQRGPSRGAGSLFPAVAGSDRAGTRNPAPAESGRRAECGERDPIGRRASYVASTARPAPGRGAARAGHFLWADGIPRPVPFRGFRRRGAPARAASPAGRGFPALAQHSETERAQRGMIVGPAAQRPVIAPRGFLDRGIVDARVANPHETVGVEFPVLVAVAAEPMSAVVVPFIGEAHGDPILAAAPDFLDQPVVELTIPLAPEKGLDRLASLEEFGAIAPAAVDGVGEGNPGGGAWGPGILVHPHLLRRGFQGEGRQRRAGHPGACSDPTLWPEPGAAPRPTPPHPPTPPPPPGRQSPPAPRPP